MSYELRHEICKAKALKRNGVVENTMSLADRQVVNQKKFYAIRDAYYLDFYIDVENNRAIYKYKI